MAYTICHVTKFTYETAISEIVMEARMQPRNDGRQRCLHFGLSTVPASRVMRYQDHDANIVHCFHIPGRHSELVVTAEALVDCGPFDRLPESLGLGAWQRLDAIAASGECWEVLAPSRFACPTPALDHLAAEMELGRGNDPLVTLRWLMGAISRRFEHVPRSTRDFVHIFIALARRLGVPCRYVSGYFFEPSAKTTQPVDGATHAWAEAWLPELGWVGWDPTNNLIAGERHIRVAVGRDYADVPPTRGVSVGMSAVRSGLTVAVRIGPTEMLPTDHAPTFVPWVSQEVSPPRGDAAARQQQQ
ncbi:MAG: transglutaminase family protein [Vicinamibacterales bacterium]